MHHSPTNTHFWNFSIDQFAFHDIPDSISYILETTHQPSLSYIGFSQGTAQAFATLSIHPTLNEKVDVFIALAPAMSPPGLASGIVSSFVKASPDLLFLAFGRKAILSSATMWQALLYPAIFTWFIDVSLRFLFGWQAKNITAYQKLAAYPHLYSFTSTKSVVHWFQIIRTGTFQMFDDEVQAPLSLTNGSKYYKVAKFPTRNIKTPIVLVYGGSDSLVDIKIMLKELPQHTQAKEVPHYEHLDFLWASDVDKLVFPHVLDALDFHAGGRSRKGRRSPFKTVRNEHSTTPQPPSYSEDERIPTMPQKVQDTGTGRVEEMGTAIRRGPFRAGTPERPTSSQSRVAAVTSPVQVPSSPINSQFTDRSTKSRPEGWWSSDEVAGTSDSPSPIQERPSSSVYRTITRSDAAPTAKHKTRLSTDSARSSDASVNRRGIGLGAAKSPVVEGLENREITTPGSAADEDMADTKEKRKGRRK